MRTGKSRKNRSNKDVAVVSNQGGKQRRLLQLLDRVLDGAAGMAGPSAFSLEQLEPRVMLSDSTLAAAGQYSLYDSSTAHATTKADIVVLNSVAGGATVGVNVTDGGSAGVADTIDLVINDPDASAAENLSVNLVSSGPIHSITFNGSAGDTLTLSVTIASITEGADAAHLTGGVTFTTAVLEPTGKFQDPDSLTTTTFAANGNIGNTALSGISGGSTAFTVNGGGSVGSVTISGGVDLSVATGTNLTIGGTPDVIITGDVTLGNHNLTVNLPDTGTASIAVGSTIAANGSGSLLVNGAASVGALSFGDFTTSEAGATTGGATIDITTNATGAITFGNVTLGDAGENDTGAVAVNVGGTGAGFTFGNITLNSTSDNADVDVTVSGTSAGGFTTGNITATGVGTDQNGDVNFSSAGTVGDVTLGNVTLGDSGETDFSDITIQSTGANGSVGNVNVGTIDLEGIANTDAQVSIQSNGTGAIGNVTLGNITIGENGGVSIGSSTATSMGNISLGALNELADSSGSLSLEAVAVGNLTVDGAWTFAGDGGFSLIASTGAIGNIGPAVSDTWNIDFVDGNDTTITLNAADDIGNITISSVDYGDDLDGTFHINADTDGGSETTVGTQIGSLGNFTITTQGDNLLADGTTPIGTNDTEFIGSVNALTGGTINFAGGAIDSEFTAGNQNLLTNTGGPGAWGAIAFGGNSPDDTIEAQDSIASITVTGTDATFTDATVNANTDSATELTTGVGGSVSDVVGALGVVSVSGSAGADSLTGSFMGVSLGGFILSNGNMDIDASTNVTGAAARAAVTSSTIGLITITTNGSTTAGGAITGGSFIADDGIGAITVGNLTPSNASVDINTINSDADGTLAIFNAANAITPGSGAAAYGGTFGGLTAQGAVTIDTLRTHETGDNTFRASQSSGSIQAGGDPSGDGIAITTIEVGGDLPNITVVETPATAGTNPIDITTLDVNGSVNNIATSLAVGDDIFITGGTIGHDLNTINAGAGNVQLSLNVVAGTNLPIGALASPVYVITDSGVDYILDISGTWSTGISPEAANLPTINTTLSFAGGNNNSVTINDLEGHTSATDTVLQIATRANATGATIDYGTLGLGTDTSTAKFNLAGFQDDFDGNSATPAQDGRHSLNELLIEGDLTGPIGNDPNPSDGTVQTLASNAPILGTIQNLEIEGEWHNSTAKIFVAGLGDLSFGSLEIDRDTNTPGSQFSFDSTSGQSTNDNNPAVTASSVGGGNSNGTTEDLEVYSALTSISGTGVVLTIPTNGSLNKSFIGPTGAFETINFTNGSSTVTGNIVIDFSTTTPGLISDIYLFGESLGVEYQAVDNANPATNSSTSIHYGQTDPTQPSLLPTEPSAPDVNAINFLEFSSAVGNISVTDIDTTNDIPANVGNILVGYVVDEDGASDVTTAIGGSSFDATYINNPNIAGVGQTVPVGLVGGVTPTLEFAGAGNISVDGSIGDIVTSGGVGSITTNDTVTESTGVNGAVPSANLDGLVTDGSAGAITINGSVIHSLVVGDPTATLPDFSAIGILTPALDNLAASPQLTDAAPQFDGPIIITGSLGSAATNVPTSIFTRPGGQVIQSPSTSYTTTVTTASDTVNPTFNLDGQLDNLASAYAGDQVSAPDGINVNITVGGNTGTSATAGFIRTAEVSGKRILVDQTENQSDTTNTADPADSITGSIIAGQTATTTDITATAGGLGNNAIGVGLYALPGGTTTNTGGDINGDIWSGESIGGTGTVIEAFSADKGTGATAAYVKGGSISSNGDNTAVDIFATGGSAGDITSNILAAADIVNIHITAGSGSGGSLLANVIAGLDPLFNTPTNHGGSDDGLGGEIRQSGGTNTISADNSIGSPSFTNVVSAAGNMTWSSVESGQIDAVNFGTASDEGNYAINSDFAAGVTLNPDATTTSSHSPLLTDINDTGGTAGRYNPASPAGGLPLFTNDDASISIGTLEADYNNSNPALAGFDSGVSLLDGTLVSAGSITITTLNVDGDATGNDGAAGGHIAAAGLGNKDTSVSDQNELFIDGGTITGTLYGTLDAGLFVPADQAGPSPLNANDVGNLVAGTVLSSGAVDVTLTIGAWNQSSTGVTGSTAGIALPDLISGAQTGVVAGYIPAFSVGATCNIELSIDVVGLPFVAPQTGLGNVPVVASSGTATDVSIAAFGSVDGSVTVAGSAGTPTTPGFNFVMSNIDAITAFDGSANGSSPNGGHVVNPSDPSTLTALQSGSIVGNPTPGNVASSLGIDNNLSITSNGNGTGGLDIEYDLAGLDYFVQELSQPTPLGFWSSFGYGSIGTAHRAPTLEALDANPTNGFGAGNLTFALIAAGQNVEASLVADNNITAHLGAATTDGAVPIPTVGGATFDADIIAGADANAVISPLGHIGSFFSGGNITGNISAGNNISSSSNPNNEITIAAIGNSAASTGNITGNITSGTNPLFEAGNTTSNINAFIIAGNSVTGTINAGNVLEFGGDNAGIFTGGIWAGAGVDLNINTTADNSLGGSITGSILTGGDLVSIQGIYSQGTIGVIEVGFGVNGGDLHGNVVAEGDIMEIQVFGDIGGNYDPATGTNTPDGPEGVFPTIGVIYTGGVIDALGVGNASGIPGDVGGSPGQFARLLHSADAYINTFGTVYDAIFMGHQEPGGGTSTTTPTIDVGGSVVGSIVNGGGVGMTTFTFDNTVYTISGTDALAVFVVTANGVDIYAYDTAAVTPGDNGGTPISVSAIGPAGIDKLVSLEGLGSVEVVGGTTSGPAGVNQIIVDNSFDVAAAIGLGTGGSPITSAIGALIVPITNFPFLVDSLVTTTPTNSILNFTNTIKVPIDADNINVQGNIGTGTSLTSSLTGTTSNDNVAIYVAGNIVGSITSEMGSIGNVVAQGQDSDLSDTEGDDDALDYVGVGETDFQARVNIGDIYAGMGGFGLGDGGSIEAQTGSVGILNVPGNINLDGDLSTFRTPEDDELSLNSIINVSQATDARFDISQNIGGLVSRTGSIGNFGDNDRSIADIGPFDIDNFDTGLHVDGSIGILHASGEIGGIFVAETGSIGIDLRPSSSSYLASQPFVGPTSAGISSDAGNIVIGAYAGTQIGNLEAKVGNIGGVEGSDLQTVLVANGGVSIDPTTLGFTAPANGVGNNGIGDIFADLGNINVAVETATDLGVFQTGNPLNGTPSLIGGISAPLGNVTVTGSIGGSLGGVSGGSSVDTDGLTVTGTTGIFRAPGEGTEFNRSLGPNGTLTVTAGGINYLVEITGGSANIDYTVNGSTVEFNSITYTSDGSATSSIQVLTQNPDGSDNPTQVEVDSLTVNGSVNTIRVDGSVDDLQVNGNLGLSNGSLIIQGDLGDDGGANVTGNVGTGPSTTGIGAANLTVSIGGSFSGFNVGGINFGDRSFAIDSVAKNTLGVGGAAAPQFFTFANPNDNPLVTGDEFVNVFIGTGSATVEVDNGFITNIVFGGTSASNVVIEESHTAMTAAQLAAQPNLIASNSPSTVVKGVTVANQFADTKLNSANDLVRNITASGTKFTLKGLYVEGSLDTITLPGNASNINIDGYVDDNITLGGTLNGLTVANDLGDVFPSSESSSGSDLEGLLGSTGGLFAKSASNITVKGNAANLLLALGLKNVNIGGDAAVVDGGTAVSNLVIGGNAPSLDVGGDAGVIKGTQTVSNVHVAGNAGIVSSGGTMSKVFIGGSSITVGAKTMTNVQVTGSVGASFTYGTSELGLSSNDFYDTDGIAELLNVDTDRIGFLGNPGALQTYLPAGHEADNEPFLDVPTDVFYGGLEARTASNVVVGGPISDTVISGSWSGSDDLVNDTIDDAYVKIGRKVITKVNGSTATVTVVDPTVIVVSGTQAEQVTL